jgi:PAS domain S-box-containing protein
MTHTPQTLLESVFDGIPEGIVVVDRSMRILFMNRAASLLLGVLREEAVSHTCGEIVGRGMCDHDCAMAETFRTGHPIHGRPACFGCRDADRRPVQVTTSLLRDASGEVTGGVVTLRDMSLVERIHHDSEGTRGEIVSRSPRMGQLLSVLPAVARSGSTVLLTGESGTGKELFARAIHLNSDRRRGPFVAVNCGALPASLIESEIFGHEAGAFTDARDRKPGQVALAKGGTLFLDEIAELAPVLQVKLLRLLQERVYTPLGGSAPIRADVRFIAATNRDLTAMVREGTFREDLFYRLDVIPFRLPPLRERREDIPALVDRFIERFNAARRKRIEGVSREALRLLMTHPLPGNVRQLENAIEHAFVLCPCGTIEREHLPPDIDNRPVVPAIEIASEMETLEALFLLAALKRNDWSRKATAQELGMNPSTLYRKMKALRVRAPSDGRSRCAEQAETCTPARSPALQSCDGA